MAGRRLPVRRVITAALIASTVTAPAALGQWTAQPTPGTEPADTGTWQVSPGTASADTWQVTPTGQPAVPPPAATAATPTTPATEAPQDATPDAILSNFAAAAAEPVVAAPPAPPAPVSVPDVEPEVTIPADHPSLVALRKAEMRLIEISGTIADARDRLETAGAAESETLEAKIESLEARETTAQDDVDRLQTRVDAAIAKAKKDAEEKAAAELAAQQAAQAAMPTGIYPTVTGTVPVVDPNMAAHLDAYLSRYGSPLAGLGDAFVYYGTQSGVDPRLLVAIAGAETSFGSYGPSQRIHNPFGMGPGIVYASWQDGIAGAARNLGGSLYKGSGLYTIAQIQNRWAPIGAGNDPTNLNSHWFKNVSKYYAELGGDPNGSVFLNQAANPTAIPVAPGVAPGIQGTVAAPTAYGVAVPVPGGGRNVGPKAAALAQTYLGVPYVWGGTSPAGFDCSGLVQFVYAKQGVKLPRVAEDQAKVGTPIAPEQLQAGDAVFFADRKGYVHHEGMYLGDGLFIHAPRTGDVVKVSSLYEPYYATQYAGARRY